MARPLDTTRLAARVSFPGCGRVAAGCARLDCPYYPRTDAEPAGRGLNVPIFERLRADRRHQELQWTPPHSSHSSRNASRRSSARSTISYGSAQASVSTASTAVTPIRSTRTSARRRTSRSSSGKGRTLYREGGPFREPGDLRGLSPRRDRRSGLAEPIERGTLFWRQAPDATRLDLGEQPVDLVALDLVQLVARDRRPALHVGRFRGDHDRRARDTTGRAVPELPRGRAPLHRLDVEESADVAAEVSQVSDVRPADAAAEALRDRDDRHRHHQPPGLDWKHAPDVDAL